MIRKTNEYAPNYSASPGDHIEELLEVHNMSQKELAERTGVTPKHINMVIKGKARITPEFAYSLEMIFDYSAEMWLSFQNVFDIEMLERKKEEELEKYAEFLSEFDYNDLVKAKYVPAAARVSERINNLLHFFRVSNIESCRKKWFSESASFRMTGVRAIKRGNIAAWIRYGQIAANNMIDESPRYDKKEFIKSLDTIRGLTAENDFQNRVTDLCNRSGVILLFVKDLPKTAISGAAYWINSEKTPCIQMSLRFKTNDHFWFTFFHEAYHVLEHHEKTMFVDINNGEKDSVELSADAYSAAMLIEPVDYQAFLSNGFFDKNSIAAFAQYINRHPGIVVGRLQHDKHIAFNTLNAMKMKMVWEEEQQSSGLAKG